ncbi:MAG: hypothetical protein KF724_05160 [Phycisphaeraceae bacterium]|nr:hypothetical protein [Phycisphaeraceae bacterium]
MGAATLNQPLFDRPAAFATGHVRSRVLRILTAALLLSLLAAGGCRRKTVGEYDTSTPDAALEAIRLMILEGRADLLPQMIELRARDITFDDGVTEASAIADVKAKSGDMLARLWRISTKIRERWPKQVEREVNSASRGRDFEDTVTRVIVDPFAALDAQRGRLSVEDLTDGTAAILWEDEPVLGGFVRMVETNNGWRVEIEASALRTSRFWPDTRHEWAVIASMMLGIENALKDFERELDSGRFRDLAAASSRVGRLVGESVVAQSIIYAMMRREPATP